MMELNEQRRAVDPIAKDIKSIRKSVDRIDGTIHGNGKMGLKTRTMILWYGAIVVAAIAGMILTGCAIIFR